MSPKSTKVLEDKNMKNKINSKLSLTIIGILLGSLIGFLITFSVMRSPKQPIENPRIMKFGDITINAEIPSDANDTYAEELTLKKDDKIFLYAFRNSLNKVPRLHLADGDRGIILTLYASKEPGKWKNVCYCTPDMIGDEYFDLDFDGKFDVKVSFGNNNELLSYHIYYDGVWRKIEGMLEQRNWKQRRLISGSDVFIFKGNSGWQLIDKNRIDPNIAMRIKKEGAR
jgi:hypothetical protein